MILAGGLTPTSSCIFFYPGKTSEDVVIAIESLHMMVSKRKKQVTSQRVLAFIKRLCGLALQLPAHGALSVLATVRSFIHVSLHLNFLPKTQFLINIRYILLWPGANDLNCKVHTLILGPSEASSVSVDNPLPSSPSNFRKEELVSKFQRYMHSHVDKLESAIGSLGSVPQLELQLGLRLSQ